MTSSSLNIQIENEYIKSALNMTHSVKDKFISFLDHGDKDVKELCQNIVWLATSKTMKDHGLTPGIDKVALEKIEFAKVDEKILLAAIYGCSSILDGVAKTKKITPAQISFPTEITSYRSALLAEITDRTFHCKRKGTEAHWFEWSIGLKDEVSFTRRTEIILNELIIEDNGNFIIDLEYLSGLLLVGGFNENLTNFAITGRMNNASAKEYVLNRLKGLKTFKNELTSKVCGNTQAINSVVSSFNQLLTNNDRTNPPLATFFGASGTGKSHLAITAADCFNNAFSSSYETYILNMENFSDDKAALKLFGSGSQYVSSSLGDLTLEAIKNPKLVVVIDEIEKAHITVQQAFLTLLSSGKATDITSRLQSTFSDCLFIFTSNLGQNHIGEHTEELSISSIIGNVKEKSLSPEMLNRLEGGEVVIFNELTAKELLAYSDGITNITKETEYKWPSFLPELLIKSLSGKSTPRSLNNQLSKLEAKISDVVMSAIDIENLKQLPTVVIEPEIILESNHSMALLLPTKIKKTFDETTIPASINVSRYSTIIDLIDDINGGKKFDSILIENIDTYLFDFDDLKDLAKSEQIIINAFSKRTQDLKLNIETENHYILSNVSKTELVNLMIKLALKNELLTLLPQQLKRKTKVIFDVNIASQLNSGVTVKIENFKNITPKTVEDLDCDYINFISGIDQKFDDVYGQIDAKSKLKEITNQLKKTKQSKVELPKGYILTGEPGTGKTIIAKAMAGECGMDFISVDANALLTSDGATKVNKVFEIAKKYSPSIVFIDEIELILANRSKASITQHLVTNALLTNLDGISTNDSQVFVLGATNFTSNLDLAACRSGRFEEIIHCYLPNVNEIISALPTLLGKYDLTIQSEEMSFIAEQLSGESFATINKVLRNTHFATQNEIAAPSIINVLLSLIKDHKFGKKLPESDEQLQKLKAYHEAGHLLTNLLNFSPSSVICASIEEREKSSGYCQLDQNVDIYRNRNTINNYIQTAMAGRVAEELFLGSAENITSGCQSDLKIATDMAKRAIIKLGYSSSGLADLSQFGEYSHDAKSEVIKWLGQATEEVKELLTSNRELLDLYAELLLEKKHLYTHDIINLWENYNAQRKGCIAA